MIGKYITQAVSWRYRLGSRRIRRIKFKLIFTEKRSVDVSWVEMAGSNTSTTVDCCSEPTGTAYCNTRDSVRPSVCWYSLHSGLFINRRTKRNQLRRGEGGRLSCELFSNLSPSCNYKHKHAHTAHVFEPGFESF